MLNQKEEAKFYSSFESCLYGVRSLFNNEKNSDLLSNSILEDTKEIDFKMDEITLIKLKNNYECDVVVKDSKGYRSYLVSLSKNSHFKHLYKVESISGQKITSEYQWRNL